MKRCILLLAACASSSSPPPPAPAPAKPGAPILEHAMRVLDSARTTAYTHATTIDEDEGRYEFDCSGFVGYVLARAEPEALGELRRATRRRPLAKHFVAFFADLPAGSAWRRIERAPDLAPGDLIAWLRPDDVVTNNTGHVMIVRGTPVRDPAQPEIWSVPIIDSTAVPHGPGDSRKATGATGLGTGEVLLIVDADDVPIGYRWSRGTRATLHRTTIALAGLRPPRPRALGAQRTSAR